MPKRVVLTRGLAAVTISLALVACSAAEDDTGVETEVATVAVTLADDSVTLDPAEVTAGPVRLVASNEGSMTHEIEILAGADPGVELVVKSQVAITEGLELVDEVEDIVPGATGELTVDLEPGTYLVMCNLPGHYAAGMSAYLTVVG